MAAAVVTAIKWAWSLYQNRHLITKLVMALLAVILGAMLAGIIVITAVAGGAAQQEAGEANCGNLPSSDNGANNVNYEPSGNAVSDIPGNFLELYRKAGKDYGLDWSILAAIGKIETDHGRHTNGCESGPATAYGSAMGPMQFIDSTWESQKVDGDGDGQMDVCNPADAIPAAAGYLKASGAPQDYYAAIFAYNNADWYVQDVLAQAETYRKAEQDGNVSPALIGPALEPVLTSLTPNNTQASQTPQTASSTDRLDGLEAAIDRGVSSTELARPVLATTPSISFGMSEANAEQLDWDLVNGDQDLTYISHSKYSSELQAAVDNWNKLSPMSLKPASGDTADVTIGDGGPDLTGGVAGLTKSEGVIYLNTEDLDRYESSYVSVIIGHELGHALGFGHPYGQLSVMTTPADRDVIGAWPTDYDAQEYAARWGTGPKSDDSGSGGGGDSQNVSNNPPSEDCSSYDGANNGGGGTKDTSKLASGDAQAVLDEAQKYLGTPYVLGGLDVCVPYETMDCTCLTLTAFAVAGLSLPDHPMEQWNYGQENTGDPKAGDLLIWGETIAGTGGHAGLAMGDGSIIHANMATNNTAITPMYYDGYMGSRTLVDGSGPSDES